MNPSRGDWFERALLHRAGEAEPAPARALLSVLTVVIPCYDRQGFLLRQCVYWHGSGASVVIVDGSPQALAVSVQKTIHGLGDVTYLHAAISMMDRLKLACAHIHTPYAILLGDDEFLLHGGLCSAIGALERDPSLVACIAQSMAFYAPTFDRPVTYGDGYPHRGYSVRDVEVAQRLKIAMANYTAATCYAVLRTPIWKKSWGQLENWSSPYVGEIQQGLTTYIWGMLDTVDEVYWMRSSENRPVTSKDFNRGLLFREWWSSPRFSSEQHRFLSILGSELEQATGMTGDAAIRVVRESVEVYIRHLRELDARAEESRTRGRAVIATARRAVVRVLKWVLPHAIILRIKSGLFATAAATHAGNLRTLDDLKNAEENLKFTANEQLFDELSAMEKLINGFYLSRKGRAV